MQRLTESKHDVVVLMSEQLGVLHGAVAVQKPINGWAACLNGSDARAKVVTDKSTKRARSSDTSKYAQRYKGDVMPGADSAEQQTKATRQAAVVHLYCLGTTRTTDKASQQTYPTP